MHISVMVGRHVSCLILLNYITLCLSDAGGKLEANWLSPYMVKTVGPNHQAVLEKDGVLLKRKVNVGQLEPYLERTSHEGIVNLSVFYHVFFVIFYYFPFDWVLHTSAHCIKGMRRLTSPNH